MGGFKKGTNVVKGTNAMVQIWYKSEKAPVQTKFVPVHRRTRTNFSFEPSREDKAIFGHWCKIGTKFSTQFKKVHSRFHKFAPPLSLSYVLMSRVYFE